MKHLPRILGILQVLSGLGFLAICGIILALVAAFGQMDGMVVAIAAIFVMLGVIAIASSIGLFLRKRWSMYTSFGIAILCAVLGVLLAVEIDTIYVHAIAVVSILQLSLSVLITFIQRRKFRHYFR